MENSKHLKLLQTVWEQLNFHCRNHEHSSVEIQEYVLQDFPGRDHVQ